MTPQLKEIYLVRVVLGLCEDIRPCVIIGVYNDIIKIVPISSSKDFYNPSSDFPIEQDHHDFAATGLDRTSYAHGQYIYNMHISEIGKKRIGILTGDLAKDFEDWLG